MNFEAFDKTNMEQYAAEVKERWGNTDAYKEWEQKGKRKTKEEISKAGERMMELFAELGSLKELPPEDEAVQEKISMIQKQITDNYYTCTNEILKDLGEMYVGDERMKQNIDKAGGEGTAEFAREAISKYCK